MADEGKSGIPDVDEAFDPTKLADMEKAVAKLDPQQAAYFLFKLETSLRRRKIQLLGYLVALVVWFVGMLFALAFFGMSTGFVGWVFLVPFALVGVILFIFGKWSDKVGNRKPPPELDIKS